MPTRRSLLRTGGLAGTGTLAAVVALPSPPDGTPIDRTVEGAAAPAAVDHWTDRPITDEGETPIARYQYRPADDADGTERWDVAIDNTLKSVIVLEGTVCAVDEAGTVLGVGTDGTEQWRASINSQPYAGTATDGERVSTNANDGMVTLGAADGPVCGTPN